jgi:coenzyme PQQ precursor peptide PqqA
MIGRIRRGARCGRMGCAFPILGKGIYRIRSIFMKWETPQATDFRFGMEITMYIAKR